MAPGVIVVGVEVGEPGAEVEFVIDRLLNRAGGGAAFLQFQ